MDNDKITKLLEGKSFNEAADLILQGSQLGTWIWNVQTGQVRFNEMWAHMLGYTRDELAPSIQTWFELAHHDDLTKARLDLESHFRGDTTIYRHTVRMQHKQGHWVNVIDQGSLLVRDQSNTPLWMVGVHLDFSEYEHKQARSQLLSTMLDNTHQGLMITDADCRIQEVNKAFTKITGYRLDEVAGHKPSLLSSGHNERALYQAMWSSIHALGHWKGTVWNRHKSGRTYPQLLTIDAITNEKTEVTHYVGAFADITDLIKEQEVLIEMASRDALTGLTSRKVLDSTLKDKLERLDTSNTEIRVLFMDLNHFKSLNDTHGHYAGDQFIIQVTDILKAYFLSDGTLARTGGDEFIGFIDIPLDQSEQVSILKDVKEAVQRLCQQYPELDLGISIGVASTLSDGCDVQTLYETSDKRMYQDKRQYRSGVDTVLI